MWYGMAEPKPIFVYKASKLRISYRRDGSQIITEVTITLPYIRFLKGIVPEPVIHKKGRLIRKRLRK